MKNELLKNRAYEKLKGLIQSGTFAPGSFLSERQLARRLGMSKTPVHSALERLDHEGFVALSPQQGVVVREISPQEIIELLDFRTAIETFVVRKLAGRLTAGQIARLKENLTAQADIARRGDVAEATRLDAEFHLLLCEFLDNREVLQSMRRLREKLHRQILRVMNKAPTERLQTSFREHTAIADAVIRGKGTLAAERVVKHLAFGRQLMLSK